MENSVNKEAFKGNINANVKDKNGFYDFNKVDVFSISKARENTKKHGVSKMYDYASKVSSSINEAIKKESEKGNSKCNVYVNLKEIFGDAVISTKEYYAMVDYITGLYSLKGYNISVYSSRMIMQFPIERDNIYLKVYIGWD